MAVDVMHLSALSGASPSHGTFSPGHKASGDVATALRHKEQSRSSQDLSGSAANSPSRSSAGGDSLSASELSWSGSPEEQQAVERIKHSRKELEDEIDVSCVLDMLQRGGNLHGITGAGARNFLGFRKQCPVAT